MTSRKVSTTILKKAKQLLDGVVYKDTDGDGLREDPDGKKLTINFAMSSGGEVDEPLSQYFLQSWKEVGLDVKLTDGRLLEFQNLVDRVTRDDKDVDVFAMGWSVGTHPKPENFSRTRQMDLARYMTEEGDEILNAISSKKAFEDDNYLKEQFKKWQQYTVDDPVEILLRYAVQVTPVNNRIKTYNESNDNTVRANWADIELAADDPVAE